jgi:sensor c-di-GMP phosphodiesterase-like protein
MKGLVLMFHSIEQFSYHILIMLLPIIIYHLFIKEEKHDREKIYSKLMVVSLLMLFFTMSNPVQFSAGVEITESVMQNISKSSNIIRELKTIGVKVSIDDFGTGYSSLSVLSNLTIDFEIDKSFINDVITNANTASLVKTMIEMGKNLNFELIAEGIENR